MPKKSRTQYSAHQKMEILKKHLVDRHPVADVCDRYGISPSMFYNWQKQLFEGGERVFERSASAKKNESQKIAKLEGKIAQKDEVIAEIMAEFIAVKKKNGAL